MRGAILWTVPESSLLVKEAAPRAVGVARGLSPQGRKKRANHDDTPCLRIQFVSVW